MNKSRLAGSASRAIGVLLLMGAALVPVGAAQAQMKLGVVNVQKLLQDSPQAKVSMQALQDEFAPRQRDIVQQQTTLKTRQDRLNRDGAVMAEAERRNVEREVREGERDLARKQSEYVEDLNVRRNEELGKLQNSLLQEVQSFAKAQNFDLIVGDGVLFAKETLDVTPQVLAALQARGPRATPPAAAPKANAP
jgi:outer membrane protein